MVKAVIFDMYETLITLFESPVYFGTQIAEDLGMEQHAFLKIWNQTESDRSVGKVSLEEALELVMRENHCYDEKLLKMAAEKRLAAKRENFNHMHPDILPMLSALKQEKIKIGLISNCFSEEAEAIRQSVLFPFFDIACLSYEQGIQKPDEEIYKRCMTGLDVLPDECIYVGDGGSHELEAAEQLGMKALQATWYLKEGTTQPVKELPDFPHVDTPMGVLKYVRLGCA